MTETRVPDVIDALLAVWAAAPGLAGITVVDGPLVTNDPLHEAVYVGYDGDPEGEGQAADSAQEWAAIGQKKRDEVVQVTCAVVVWNGRTAVRPTRVRVYELLAAVSAAVRADPSLGLPPPTVAEMASGQLFQSQRQSGVECRIPFVIAVKTRI